MSANIRRRRRDSAIVGESIFFTALILGGGLFAADRISRHSVSKANRPAAAVVQTIDNAVQAKEAQQVDSYQSSSGPALTGKAAEYEQLLKESPEVRAVIEMISCEGEGTCGGQFNIIVGTDEFGNPNYFDDYSDHPRTQIWIPNLWEYSDAAGIGQFMSFTWDEVSRGLELESFTPKEQLVGMVYLLDYKRGVLDEILEGNLKEALPLMSCEWAGLPDYCRYGQHGTTYGSVEADAEALVERYNSYYLPRARAGEDIVSQTIKD